MLAIGYAELNCQALEDSAQRALLSEGLYGAYAQITAVYEEGRNAMHPTPVFAVEGDWRPGMSGGPVFNSTGGVVGVVSRSMAPVDGHPGVGWAVSLGRIEALLKSLRSS